MEFGILEVIILLTALTFGIYFYFTKTFDYWEKRGVPGPKPSVPFGNFADILLRRKPLNEKIGEMYDAYKKEPFFGYFIGTTPFLIVNDPDLISHVLIKDFNAFSDRGVRINEKLDPLSAHLFNIGGKRWRMIRQKLTPVFTTRKLRHLLNLISECGDNLERHLKEQVAKNEMIECREQAARYSTNVIGSCAFGINTNALADEDSAFRKAGRKIFEPSSIMLIKRILREFAPRIYTLLRLSTVPAQVSSFFIESIKEIIRLREREKIVRNDFVDMLMQFSKDSASDEFEWTDNVITAQAYIFFVAGFETSSTTISFALWELARAPETQEKLRREVLEYDKMTDGEITYKSINEMKYLDMVVKETLRKNPPVVILIRELKQDYVIPGTKTTLSSGQKVHIPAYALHHDPKYYPKPEVFDPDRFTEEAKKARHPMVYLPFGAGPKNCIGERFGYHQVKVALIKILKNFRVHPTTKTDEPYKVDKNSAVLTPIGGVILRFERLST